MESQNKVVVDIDSNEFSAILQFWQKHEWYDVYNTFADWITAMGFEYVWYHEGGYVVKIVFPSNKECLAFQLKYL